MKKQTISNLIMVLVIAAMAVDGVLFALDRKSEDTVELGSLYHVTELAPDALCASGSESCTVTVICTTVLDRLEALDAAKQPYLPKDGIILPKTAVSIREEDTAFSVLQRACEAAGIPLEYSWTPLYDSYYVEGIQHLYEFDCGTESGWMFAVNGAFPNCGSSSYVLQNGDEIVWCYTCAALGADVGAEGIQ